MTMIIDPPYYLEVGYSPVVVPSKSSGSASTLPMEEKDMAEAGRKDKTIGFSVPKPKRQRRSTGTRVPKGKP